MRIWCVDSGERFPARPGANGSRGWMANFLDSGGAQLVPDLPLDDQFQNLLAVFPDQRTNVLFLVVDTQRGRSLRLVPVDDRVEQINNDLRVLCGLDS